MKIFKKIAGIALSLAMVFSLVAVLGASTAQAADEFVVNSGGVLTAYNGKGGDITLPKSVRIVGNGAFSGNGSITSVKMTDNVTIIEANAFDSCTSLKSVKFSKKLVKIDNNAFYGCSALTDVTLPNGLESVGIMAFGNCSSLNGISIPDSLREVGSYAFGHYIIGGYNTYSNFVVMGGEVAKLYAQKYSFPYVTKADLKIKPNTLKKAGKTSAKFTWLANDRVDKVQIQYSTKANFSGKKTINVTNNLVTSRTISGLKKGATYYVRVRGIRTVAGTTYNSAWSAKKKVIML